MSVPEKKNDCCPICGGSLVGASLQWIRHAQVIVWPLGAARLSPIESSMFDVLWKQRGNGEIITAERLFLAAFAHVRSGGPPSARSYPHVMMCKLRAKLSGSGITIIGTRGLGAGYRIEVRR